MSLYHDKITKHYAVAALWSLTDDKGEPLDANYSFDDNLGLDEALEELWNCR